MDNVTELSQIEAPDCSKCKETTRRAVGKTFDIEGPGMVGIIYDCDNEKCKILKEAIERYQLRAIGLI